MVKSNLVCAVKASCSLMVFSLFFGDSATTLLFEIFMFKVHKLRYWIGKGLQRNSQSKKTTQ